MAVPICYCKPGTSALVKKRIEDKALEFQEHIIHYRQICVSKSKVATEHSRQMDLQLQFVVDELIHEEDILVKEGTHTVFVGQGVQQTTILNQHISQQMAH